MLLEYAFMGWAVHMHKMEEGNSVDKMVAEGLIVHMYKVCINL